MMEFVICVWSWQMVELGENGGKKNNENKNQRIQIIFIYLFKRKHLFIYIQNLPIYIYLLPYVTQGWIQ